MSLTRLCPPLPGFPRARWACWQSWGSDGFIVCALPGPGFLYGRHHPSPSLRLRSSLFSLKWGCVYQNEVRPCASHRSSPRRWQRPRGTAYTSLQDLINQVACGSSGGLGPGRRPSSLFPPAAALVPASRLPRLRSPGRELLSSLSSLQQQDPARGPQRRHHGEGGWTRQV